MLSIKRISFCVVLVLFIALCFAERASAGDGDLPREDKVSRALLDQFADRHRGIDRRHERAMAKYEVDTDIEMYRMMSSDNGQKMWEYKYAAPDRLWISSQMNEVICDGEHLWGVQEFTGQYIQRPKPKQGGMFQSVSELLGDSDTVPVSLAFLLSEGKTDGIRIMNGTPVVTGHAAETKGDVASIRFDVTITHIESSQMPGVTMSTEGSVWFGAESGIIHTMEFDITEAMRQGLEQVKKQPEAAKMMGIDLDTLADDAIRSATATYTIETLPTDSITNNDFVITDDDSLERVESFEGFDGMREAEEMLVGSPTTADLIGEESPGLSGVDQDGAAFDLSNHKGNVVLLLVGPSVGEADLDPWLLEVEGLRDAFEGMPVSAVASIGQMSAFAFGNNKVIDPDDYSIPVLTDMMMRSATKFHVQMQPALIVIDQEGVVQAAHETLPEIQGDSIVDSVATLLEGGQLYDPAVVQDRRDRKRAARAEQEMVAPSIELAEVDADRLRGKTVNRWGRFSPPPYGASAQVLDADGDGILDVVTGTGSGALVVVDGVSRKAETIQLESVERRNVTIVAYDRMSGINGDGWVVVMSKRTPFGTDSRETIGAFRDDGSNIWMRTLRSPNGQTIYTHDSNKTFALGDLTGDGHDEIVAGFSMSSGTGIDDSGSMLLVLDSEGDLLALKEMEYGFQSVDVVPAQAGREAWISIVGMTGITRVEFKR